MDAGKILDDFRNGVITREQALERLNILPYEDIGFAKLDHHRQLRRGGVETVFCAGKTAEQVRVIFERFQAVGDNVLGTRATPEQADYVRAAMPLVKYDPASRLLTLVREPKPLIGCVAVCTGGTSDLPVAEEAAGTAEFFGSRVKRFYDVGIAGIHRLFACIDEIRTANAVVAIAGMEGALGSVIAGTSLERIGGNIISLFIVFAILYWVSMARLIRGQILSLREQEYVLASQATGAKSGWIIRKHLIPNCISVVIISTALQIPNAIFTESYLSFLGLGVNAPMSSLGSLASDALNGISSYAYRLVIPAIVISLIVLSLNLFGDGLRDAFDPKLNA